MVPAPRRSDRRSDGVQIQCHGAWIWFPMAGSDAPGGGELSDGRWRPGRPGRGGGGVRRRVRGGGDMERSAAVFGDGSGAATT